MAEEATKTKGKKGFLARRKAHCTACCVALAVLLILGALALAFYFRYRPRPPRVVATPVDVSIDEFALLPHPTLRVSVGVHVVVANPSNSPFRYGASVGAVTYHGAPVGELAAVHLRGPAAAHQVALVEGAGGAVDLVVREAPPRGSVRGLRRFFTSVGGGLGR